MEIDKELMEIYTRDLQENVERINLDLIELEKNGPNQELLNRVMRLAHNIKGSSGMVGFDKMKEIAHAIETVMIGVINQKYPVTAELITLLLNSMDKVEILKDEFLGGNVTAEIESIVEQLKNVESILGEKKRDEKTETKAEQPIREQDKNKEQRKIVVKAEQSESIRINLKAVENITNHIGEMAILQNQLYNNSKILVKQYRDPMLHDLFGMNEQMVKEVRRLFDEFLQLSMTPIETVFKNYPRMIRDLEQALSKKMDLVIEESGARLDKNIAEEIGNPLMHMIRNSADHGIETPQERLQAGKPERGIIKLSATQQGERIIVTIEDDGKGIDEKKVIASAIRKRLITEKQAKSMSKKEMIRLIFHPGFSTAEKVSDISGRGVGMDVVLNGIKKIHGTIEIETEVGKGTKMVLKLPTTLSIMPCIIFEINKKMIGVPALNIDNVMSIHVEQIKRGDEGDFIVIDDVETPIIKLHNKFGGSPKRHSGKYYFVICGLAEKRVAVLVDRIIGNQRVIVRQLSSLAGKVKNIAGAALLEDGRVSLIINVNDLIENTLD